jgi:hypothetical protein
VEAALLLLALVGGYIFASTWNFTKFKVLNQEGYRLYFRAAFYGVFLFIVAFEIRVFLSAYWSGWAALESLGRASVSEFTSDKTKPFPFDLAICSILAMFLAAPLAMILNFGFWKKKWALDAIGQNDVERILQTAATTRQAISVTLDDRKVYVGFVLSTLEPVVERKTLVILPLMSGYRTDRGKIEFTTYYDWLYEEDDLKQPATRLGSTGNDHKLLDFEIVLPLERLHSINLFDLDIYKKFQEHTPGPKPTPGLFPESDSNSG